MTAKEMLKNNILLQMQHHVSSQILSILGDVLTKLLSAVEVVQLETLPATADDSNAYIWELFMLKKAPKLSARTVERYRDVLRHFADHSRKPFTTVTGMDVELYLAAIRKSNTDVSLDGQRRCLSAFFSWMRKAHLIVTNPCDEIEPYKIVQKPIDHMEPEEMEQLKTGCRTKRDRALIEFLRSTAVRVGEAEQVRVCDIDWRTGEVNTYGEKGRRYRTACLDSVAIKYLSDYVESRHIPYSSTEPLFTRERGDTHKGLTRASIRGVVDAIRERSGIQRRVYPHLFRKTTATNIIKRGGSVHDAGEYLGHKERSTAGRYYTYMGKDHTVEIFKKYVAIV